MVDWKAPQCPWSLGTLHHLSGIGFLGLESAKKPLRWSPPPPPPRKVLWVVASQAHEASTPTGKIGSLSGGGGSPDLAFFFP